MAPFACSSRPGNSLLAIAVPRPPRTSAVALDLEGLVSGKLNRDLRVL